jgi:RNA polymerase sigma-70 factor, ECF subfamily
MSTEERVPEPCPEESARHLEIAQSLLDQLKARRRMAFVLRETEGRSYAEVASILGTSEATVRVRVWRARSDLHEGFRKYLSRLEKGIGNEKSL